MRRPSTSARIKYFNYLERLRKSGKTNMLGAGPFLQKRFDLSEKRANEVLVAWLDEKEAQGGAAENTGEKS